MKNRFFYKVFAVWCFQVRQMFCGWKNIGVFLLTGIFVFSNAQQVGDFADLVQLGTRPWIFPHLTNDFICQLVFVAACVALFCDAPWDTDMSPYVLARSGRSAQTAGQLLFILTLGLAFTLYLFAVSVAAILPSAEFAPGWGKVLGTLARTNAGMQIGLSFTVSDYLIGAYSPGEATCLSLALEWGCFVWLGLAVYLFNRNFVRRSGIYIAAAFVLLDITIANALTPFAYRFSPVTLAQLSALSGLNARYGISLNYAVGFFAAGNLLMAITALLLSRRKSK
ncbi:MAG: hypothetical protein LBQ15_09555 [Clostridium sp.]|jgi:hypothetical protein|nr:hypothetical protein [Clostridium sp.]